MSLSVNLGHRYLYFIFHRSFFSSLVSLRSPVASLFLFRVIDLSDALLSSMLVVPVSKVEKFFQKKEKGKRERERKRKRKGQQATSSKQQQQQTTTKRGKQTVSHKTQNILVSLSTTLFKAQNNHKHHHQHTQHILTAPIVKMLRDSATVLAPAPTVVPRAPF